MEQMMTIRKHLDFGDCIKDRIFIYGICDDVKALPDMVNGVQSSSPMPVKIEYIGKTYIVSADFIEE